MKPKRNVYFESLEHRRLLTCEQISPFVGPEPEAGYGLEICGQVFEDQNGNGIREDGELGLNGWTLSMTTESETRSFETRSFDLNADGEIDRETETGLFGFINVAEGNVTSRMELELRDEWWSSWPDFDGITIPRFALDYRVPLGLIERTDDPNGDGQKTADDIDVICQAIRDREFVGSLDQNRNRRLSVTDAQQYAQEHLNALPGDANLDGVFNSADLVMVLQSGEYEDDIEDNSTWIEGDWNCDGDFNAHDLIVAMQKGSYQRSAADVASRVNDADDPLSNRFRSFF